jgi:hypothetical protein
MPWLRNKTYEVPPNHTSQGLIKNLTMLSFLFFSSRFARPRINIATGTPIVITRPTGLGLKFSKKVPATIPNKPTQRKIME